MSRRSGAAAIVLTCSLIACAEASVPAELIGTWATTAPSHADRRFRITADSLFLETGSGIEQAHNITSVVRFGWVGDGGIRIDYERNGLENTLRIEMNPDSGYLRLANRRDIIWLRQSTTPP